MFVDDKVVDRTNDLDQKLTKLKKLKNYQNLAKSPKLKNFQILTGLRKLNCYLKLFKSKKVILDKSKILINLIVATNNNAIGYLISKNRLVFTQLKQVFIKTPIV